MKQWKLFGLVLALSALLMACGGSSTPEPAAPAGEATAVSSTSTDTTDTAVIDPVCGDRSQLASQINFFNWGDYMDPDILTQFEEQCGVRVNQDIFSSNEDLIAKVQAGNSGYDLVVPSDYAVQIMVERGLLRALDRNNIPNISNLNPDLMGLFYDPNNEYSLPYQWGVTGIAYNTNAFDSTPDSWSHLIVAEQACENRGFASLLDDEREAVGAALKYLGYSYNDTDPAHHQEAQALLSSSKECLAGYNSDNYTQTLAGEEVVIAQAWSGGTAQARSENEAIAFVIPKEGGAIWQDNMAIPFDAPNAYTAEIFINYLLDAKIGAQLSNYNYYFTPNQASELLLDEDYFAILTEGGMMIDDETYERLEWIERNDETIIFSDTWTAVKAR
jgi:spermidine/putrescine transport system substrate-binding protein